MASLILNRQSNSPDLSNDELCQLGSSTCHFSIGKAQGSIGFISPPVTEEELTLMLRLPEGVSFEQGWVEGINMYMGKTPLISDTEAIPGQPLELVTFLGSCTLPQMQWQLNILLNTDNQLVQRQFVFVTQE